MYRGGDWKLVLEGNALGPQNIDLLTSGLWGFVRSYSNSWLAHDPQHCARRVSKRSPVGPYGWVDGRHVANISPRRCEAWLSAASQFVLHSFATLLKSD